MANKMLIDAAHPEETRVVVLRGNRVEEFDHESLNRRQLRGNIYLAKVTRVEPSLQAAFVDFGGNRHGFLAFSEIHPDYYQIPVADRQALLEEEAAEASRAEAEEAADDEQESDDFSDDQTTSEVEDEGVETIETASDDVSEAEDGSETSNIALKAEDTDPRISGEDLDLQSDENSDTSETVAEDMSDTPEVAASSPEPDAEPVAEQDSVSSETADTSDADADQTVEAKTTREDESETEQSEREDELQSDDADVDDVESVGSEDVMEEVPDRVRRRRRSYKIQEVIKRRQIILVQVVKEERGNKGAALTTYLSLAGRYTVLMPNTARGGGISRKITNHTDRRRLRKIANELEVPEGMGLIIRTAGASRTKAEIKRDFEYLLRLWENVRDHTLQSTAPSLVYEEGSLIKRSIRDLYSKEIDEILVAGDGAYREAKDFMRMLMPSHAKNVQPYKDPDPLFVRHRIERQLNSMFSPYVTLRSGGYIVINQTEALVSIDVNSGKATKEHSIEDTALKTNLEAADEIARQLRLRDLAGLIVIDFIDMDERRNNRAVERKMKDCLRNDRARIQIGRISHFGLLEMSRQRLRTGVLEGSTVQCPHCQGTGMMRSTESVSLTVLRAIEDALLTGPNCDLSVTTSTEVALYILNQKRPYLKDIEARYGTEIMVHADETLHGANFTVERINRVNTGNKDAGAVVQMDWAHHEPHSDVGTQDSPDGEKKRGRRRRGGRGRNNNDTQTTASSSEPQEETVEASEETTEQSERDAGRRRSRRRGRRGGRRNRASGTRPNAEMEGGDSEAIEAGDAEQAQRSDDAPGEINQGEDANKQAEIQSEASDVAESAASTTEDQTAEKPKRRRRRRSERTPKADKDASAAEETADQKDAIKKSEPANGNSGSDKPADHGEQPTSASSEKQNPTPAEPQSPPPATTKGGDEEPSEPKRGWWQRRA